MYSKVKIGRHPVHPMLVSFPVALYTVTLACFVAYAVGASTFWFQVGLYANLAGVVCAVIAAVPGLIDWALGIPSGTRAKATGLVHMLFNVAALLAFALNLVLEWPQRLDPRPPLGAWLILPALGWVLTGAAGFFGWKLVQTHHVGVDLTPDQERLEPRPMPPAPRAGTAPHTGPGKI